MAAVTAAATFVCSAIAYSVRVLPLESIREKRGNDNRTVEIFAVSHSSTYTHIMLTSHRHWSIYFFASVKLIRIKVNSINFFGSEHRKQTFPSLWWEAPDASRCTLLSSRRRIRRRRRNKKKRAEHLSHTSWMYASVKLIYISLNYLRSHLIEYNIEIISRVHTHHITLGYSAVSSGFGTCSGIRLYIQTGCHYYHTSLSNIQWPCAIALPLLLMCMYTMGRRKK